MQDDANATKQGVNANTMYFLQNKWKQLLHSIIFYRVINLLSGRITWVAAATN